jgi:hypothetical protein
MKNSFISNPSTYLEDVTKQLYMFLLLRITVMCTSFFFIISSLLLWLPVIQAHFFSLPRFSIRRKTNPQKLNVFFLDQNRRNFTPQKLLVIRYLICTTQLHEAEDLFGVVVSAEEKLVPISILSVPLRVNRLLVHYYATMPPLYMRYVLPHVLKTTLCDINFISYL